KDMKNTKLYTSLLMILAIGFSACKKDYLDPGSVSSAQVVSNASGLYAMANSLQYTYSVGRQSVVYSAITTDGLVCKQFVVLNAGNTDEIDMEKGGTSVLNTNALARNLWNQSHLVRNNADMIIDNLGSIQEPATKSALMGYAAIFKALALGNLAQFWEQTPIKSAKDASFVSRIDALKEAVRVLKEAEALVAVTPPNTSKLVVGIDIKNTIYALLARYNLLLGKDQEAIDAANKVDMTKISIMNFDDVNRNPMFDVSFSNKNVCEPLDNFGLPAASVDANDKRIAFYYNTADIKKINKGKNSFFKANNTAIPVYYPSEMYLIKAEAYANLNNLASANAEINQVLTKPTDALGIGVGNALPAFSGADKATILTEVYRNRMIELFLTGTNLESSRRLGGASNRKFLPYPQTERLNNINTPADPAN
ncbi:MAG: RagB/SusD family nutrient uptake outer membrane protein, partial [Sphingobacteriaceae bacterium]|nr:RagB/SusD family nutrient uptake outer membrane protein [Sphingobacteriaceae bacterium]